MVALKRTEDDWQQQADELIALASILQADFRLTDGPEVTGDTEQDTTALMEHDCCCEQLQCTVAVRIDLPSAGIDVQIAGKSESDGACWHVQQLPPITLQLALPANYPSHQPPSLQLSASWLSQKQQAALQEHLLSLWKESVGTPVCYTWVDWLQHSSLAFLSISDTVELEQQATGSEQILVEVLAYDAAQKLHAFQHGTWTCGICFEELPGTSCIQASLQCGHAYCKDCMQQHCRLHVREGSLEQLRCPQPDCKGPLDRTMVNGLLSQEEKDRFEAVELERTLKRMVDAVYCPRCSIVCLEDADNCAQCTKCYFTFCSLCNESWHPGVQCVGPAEKLELMRRRMAGTKSGAREFKRQEDELKNLAHIEKNCKKCPSCNMAIVRSEGCNKMRCTSCGSFFCYKCGDLIFGYDHFGEGKCILFDLDEIQRWENQMAQQMGGFMPFNGNDQNVQQIAPQRLGRAIRCSQCGRGNYKQGNNNIIRCTQCEVNFCYCCKQVLPKGSVGKHFGPTKCKQHSAD